MLSICIVDMRNDDGGRRKLCNDDITYVGWIILNELVINVLNLLSVSIKSVWLLMYLLNILELVGGGAIRIFFIVDIVYVEILNIYELGE